VIRRATLDEGEGHYRPLLLFQFSRGRGSSQVVAVWPDHEAGIPRQQTPTVIDRLKIPVVSPTAAVNSESEQELKFSGFPESRKAAVTDRPGDFVQRVRVFVNARTLGVADAPSHGTVWKEWRHGQDRRIVFDHGDDAIASDVSRVV